MPPTSKYIAAILMAAAVAIPSTADAFCGFYVSPGDAPLYADASRVALMREGTRTALSMSNDYRGPAADFAMVVPIPVVVQKDNVKTLPRNLFDKLETLTAPRLVEYWEQDPCAPGGFGDGIGLGTVGGFGHGAGGGKKDKESDYKVKIEAQFAVGEYDIVVLSAEQSDGLERWLIDNKYNVPKGAAAALAPYIKEQQKFFVAKVNMAKVTLDAGGVATLSPLRVVYESTDFRLPVRLGLLNAAAKQDLIVYVLSKESRYEVANFAKATIPTNIDVSDATRSSFGPFYAALFDRTMEKAGGKAVITEYSWSSASCDPCPTPPLSDNDVSTLGGDVLLGLTGEKEAAAPSMGGRRGFGAQHPVVLTRLHARYDATTLGEDLVFAKAPPIVGGRERHVRSAPGAPGASGGGPGEAAERGMNLEQGATAARVNNFQARYAIRHPWTGPIACAVPVRGLWGAKPGAGTAAPTAATKLASVKRDGLSLASFVRSKATELDLLDLPLAGAAPSGVASGGSAPAGSTSGPVPSNPSGPQIGPLASVDPKKRPSDAAQTVSTAPMAQLTPGNPPSPWSNYGLGQGPAMWIGLLVAFVVGTASLTISIKGLKH